MFKFNFRIGTKLGLTAGVGVLLVCGMLANEMIGNGSVEAVGRLMIVSYSNKSNAQTAEIAIARTQAATRDISLARAPEQLDKGLQALRENVAKAGIEIDAAGHRAVRKVIQDLYRETKTLVDGYLTAGIELAAAQKAVVDSLAKRTAASATWNKSLDQLLAAPSLSALANRQDVEIRLREAGASFNAALAAGWRFAATSEPQQKEQAARDTETAIGALKTARGLTGDKDVVAAIDGLVTAVAVFKAGSEEVVKAEESKARVYGERVQPIAKDIGARIDKAVGAANEMAEIRGRAMVADMTRVGRIGLAVGLLVVLVMIGTAVFSMLDIARPFRRIGAVLLELTQGNKMVEIPYTSRGDEVGDAARAADNFRDNLVRMERLEAEQREARAAGRRREASSRGAGGGGEAAGRGESGDRAQGGDEPARRRIREGGRRHRRHRLVGFHRAGGSAARHADQDRGDDAATLQRGRGGLRAGVEQRAVGRRVRPTRSPSSVDEIGRQVQESSRIAGEAVEQAREDRHPHRDAVAGGRPHRRRRQADHRDRRADQSAGAQCDDRGGARRRSRQGLRGGRQRGEGAGRADRQGDRGDRRPDRRHADRDRRLGRRHQGDRRHDRPHLGDLRARSPPQSRNRAPRPWRSPATSSRRRAAPPRSRATSPTSTAAPRETGSASTQVLTSAQSLSGESSHLKREVEKFLTTVRAA